MKILIINGPNLNRLGTREPQIYGTQTDKDIVDGLRSRFADTDIDYFQSNHEGAIVDRLHEADGKYDGIVLNAAAYSHTSVAILDAILAIETPVVEVHMSNIYARETFRRQSVIAAACKGMICGFGADSYRLAIESLRQ
ncbi:MAG: type II 3-dehydroquinate dehydratase [Prevotella sp.]|nr:type II 3-dehydroquinate dehydratase [Prevotella sp.]MBQ9671215.1 type II 3-dehydroquinate dehydratase [Prevotella sp.]MDY6229841.1 type II 3-dehydroquinate dehydratase [Prevotella sp.]